MNRLLAIVVVFAAFAVSSCKKEKGNPCYVIQVEIDGPASIDSVYYSFLENDADADTLQNAYKNLITKFSPNHHYCGYEVGYTFYTYHKDTTAPIRIKIYADNVKELDTTFTTSPLDSTMTVTGIIGQ